MQDVREHYSVPHLAKRILDGLTASGKDVDALTIDDLAAVDGFHIRGRAATKELAAMVDVEPVDRVLDVGCGVGGTCRYLASEYRCRAVGIDLTDEYVDVARLLSERVGLGRVTEFVTGSALNLPFEPGDFDITWTEHAQMNIADKRSFYTEMGRVLRPGGKLAFHDIFAGENPAVRYPVPWAGDASISRLLNVQELPQLLDACGFERLEFKDVTEAATKFVGAVVSQVREAGWNPLALHVLMGETALTKFENMLAALESEAVRVVMAVYRRR